MQMLDQPVLHPYRCPDFRNVVIVGVTQSGKTTLLNTVAEHCGTQPYQPLPTGNGLLSCTQQCATREFQTTAQSCDYQPLLENREPLHQGRELTLQGFLANRAFTAHRKYHSALPLKVRLIDTPGLADSNGNDDEIVTDIAKSVNLQSSISCVFLVIKKSTTFTANVKEKIQYYMNFLQDYNSSVAVIHTGWSPLEPSVGAEREKSRLFIDSQLEGVNLTHFFVDLVLPSQEDDLRKPYIEHCKALRCNTLNSILCFIQSCPIIPSKKILIPKTDTFRKVHDQKLLSALDGFEASTKNTLEIMGSTLDQLVSQVEAVQKDISKLECESRKHRERLDYIDVDTEVYAASKVVQMGWGLTSRSVCVEVQASCQISNVLTFCDNSYTSWSGISHRDTVAKAVCESSWLLGCSGRLVALAPSKRYHIEEICNLKLKISEDNILANKKKVELASLLETRRESEAALADFQRRIDLLAQVRCHVSQVRVSLQDYVELLKIYHPNNQTAEIGEIVKQYCEFLHIQNFWIKK